MIALKVIFCALFSHHLGSQVHHETNLAARERARGEEASDWELGVVMGQIRRSLSLDFVRAQSLCLLARLCYLGEGSRMAVARRQQAGREEEARRREQQSHYPVHVQGRGNPRAGDILISG